MQSCPFSVQARHDKRRFQSNSHQYVECFVYGGRGCDRVTVNLLLGLHISSGVGLQSALFHSRADRTSVQLLVWGLLPANPPYSMEHKRHFNYLPVWETRRVCSPFVFLDDWKNFLLVRGKSGFEFVLKYFSSKFCLTPSGRMSQPSGCGVISGQVLFTPAVGSWPWQLRTLQPAWTTHEAANTWFWMSAEICY